MYASIVTPATSVLQIMATASTEASTCTSRLQNNLPDQKTSEASGTLPHERQSLHPNSPNGSDSTDTSMGFCAPDPHKCNRSFVREGLEVLEEAKTVMAENGLCSKQGNKFAGGKGVSELGGEVLQIAGKIMENTPICDSTAKNPIVKENLSLVAGRIMGTQGGGILGTTGELLLGSASHSESKSAILENSPLNKISEALDQTGIGKTLGTVNEVIAVTKAVKNGDVSAILKDEHVQELGKKAFEIGVSAILTASGAGAVMAVASATSDVIAAAKEVKEMEDNGGHGVASFILESGAKIALKAAMKGSGAEAALSLAAPILEPLAQKAADEVAQRGADLIDQAITNTGAKSSLINGIDAMINAEETVASVFQLKAPVVEKNLEGAILQTGKTIFQQVAGTGDVITGSVDKINDQIVKHQEQSITPTVNKALLHIVSACTENHIFGGATDITPSNRLDDPTMTTLVSGAIDVVNARLIGRFEPVRAGLELLEDLYRISKSKGLYTINGLSAAAITKTYELTKNKISTAEKYQTLFDPDGDGVVHYNDTVRGLTLLGLTGFVARLAAYNFHVMFSYPTSDSLFPRFNLSLPIQVKNMSRTIQGRNWGTFERARFITDRPGEISSKVWLTSPQGFQILLFLFEWGTTWPFQPHLGLEHDSKPEEIGLVFTNAIIPLILNHWTLFQNQSGLRSH